MATSALVFENEIPKQIRECMKTALIGWYVRIDGTECLVDGYNKETESFVVRKTDSDGNVPSNAPSEEIKFDTVRTIHAE